MRHCRRAREGEYSQTPVDCDAPLVGRRTVLAVPGLVFLRHRDDVLAVPERHVRGSPRPITGARSIHDPAAAGDRICTGTVAGPALEARLTMLDKRPVYRFRTSTEQSIVYADTGERQASASPELMARLASSWSGQPASGAAVDEIDVDQWTVEERFKSCAHFGNTPGPMANRFTSRNGLRKSCSTRQPLRVSARTSVRSRIGCISRRFAGVTARGVRSSPVWLPPRRLPRSSVSSSARSCIRRDNGIGGQAHRSRTHTTEQRGGISRSA